MRVITSLRTDPKLKNQQVADGVKFSIVSYDVKRNGEYVFFPHPISTSDSRAVRISASSLRTYASETYPDLFGDDQSNLHLCVHVDFDSDLHKWGLIPQLATLGLIPFPSWADVDFTVNVNDSLDAKPVSGWYQKTDSFVHKYYWWSTWCPLGYLPMPGPSDFRRSSNIMDDVPSIIDDEAKYTDAIKRLTLDSLTEAVARCVMQMDKTKLQAASDIRKKKFKQFNINGRTFWTFRLNAYAETEGQPLEIGLELYSKRPKWGTKPFEKVIVARMVDGQWQPVTSYLQSMKEATTATVLLVDGIPSEVVIKKIDRPSLEDFIELPSGSSSGDIRRNNGILIEIKSLTLPLLIQEKDAEYLIKLVIRIEKAALHLNETAQKFDGMVQKEIVSGGNVNTSQLSEMATLCRQRIAIFNPILSALQQAAAERK